MHKFLTPFQSTKDIFSGGFMIYKRRIWGFECDIYGHLNNAKYLQIYEEARADALQQMKMPIKKLKEMGISIYLTKIEMEFKKGIPLEENIIVKSAVVKMSKVISIWKHEIFNSKKELCNTAIVKGAFIMDGKPKRISKELYEHFLQFKEKEN